MIRNLTLQNFKSIKSLSLGCKRVNLFIGKPNTGKSNILEALGLLSRCGSKHPGLVERFVRMTNPSNLFYDEEILDKVVEIHLTTENQKDYVFCLAYDPQKELLRVGSSKKHTRWNFSHFLITAKEYGTGASNLSFSNFTGS